MSYVLYNALASLAYGGAYPVLLGLRGRWGREWYERLGRPELGASAGPRVWIHAASVGELTGVGPLVATIRSRHPSCEVVLSTLTRTGHETARAIPGIAHTFFLPVDVPRVVRRGIGAVDPDALVIMETEIWPNLIRESKRAGVRTAVVNGRISGRSFRRYAVIRGFLADVLEQVDFLGVQTELDRERFVRLGAPPERVQVLGSSKYDAAVAGRDENLALNLRRALGERNRLPIWVAGCLRSGEEAPVLDGYVQAEKRWPHTVVLAPRHLEQTVALQRAAARRGLPWRRWTEIRDEATASAPTQVVILDTIGELSRFYALAQVAFVGGSLVPLGGHNPLEPAAFGIPVFFGKHMDNYRLPADALVRAGGGVRVGGAGDIAQVLERWLGDPDRRVESGRRAQAVVEDLAGAAKRYVEALEERGILGRDGPPAGAGGEPRVFAADRVLLPRPASAAASVVHRGASAVNRWLYRSGLRHPAHLQSSVVSVGNLSLGGTGKTPMVEHLARRFVKKGFRVAILSRGYRGAEGGGTLVVSAGAGPQVSWRKAGDEPYWLAMRVPGAAVLVGGDRVGSARYAEQVLGSELLILDDGFQHRRLERALDIVLIDNRSWTADGRFVGDHWLREGLSALAYAHVVVLSHRAAREGISVGAHLEKRFPHLVVVEARHRPTGLRRLSSDESVGLSIVEGERIAAVSGLASPSRFEETLLDLGATLTHCWRFPDHHPFSESDLISIHRSARPKPTWFVTTEKDAVRLESLARSLGDWLVLEVDLEITMGHEEFDRVLDRTVRRNDDGGKA